MMRLLALLCAAAGARAGAAVNLTVVGLRPYALTGLDEKNTADLLGDLFFLFGDRIAWRKSCRDDPTGRFCQCEVTCDDNVYTLYTVEALTGIDHAYARCNAGTNNLTDPQYRCEGGDPFHVGYSNISTRYPNVSAACHQAGPPYPEECSWKYMSSKKTGGAWYSHPAAGNCATHPGRCSWRILQTLKIVNETCVNDNVVALFERRNAGCFAQCTPYDPASDCYLQCFFDTLRRGEVSAPELHGIFAAAFASDDPAAGGCPGRPIKA
eukprot:TRINITY_DN3844_c1_g2_i1.p1 TRINITY_DN3844_c1_g2~~TRINITY_DN3844_c1_g2_i1.p1  ORF type:complete len:267 (+),score=87.62 TRINITY_DN3844_c1_g2_i1:67-867(+)